MGAKAADGGPAGQPSDAVALLPPAVRARIVVLTAETLDELDAASLPPALRPVLSFARQRRSRLAAAPIASALADEEFRSRVAVQVRAARAALAAALDAGEPVAADPVEVAALAYLLRPPSWRSMLATAGTSLGTGDASPRAAQDEVAGLRGQLRRARAESAQARTKSRTQLAGLRDERAQLRRLLAQERAAARQDSAQAVAKLREREEQLHATRRELGDSVAEQRRLRARLAELTREHAAARTESRGQRSREAVRARLLLDTLADAAVSLRRELALPPVETLPADTVTSAQPPADATADGGRASGRDDPDLLEHLVSLPRAHLLVDGYNVTKLAWPAASLEAQRARLLRELAPLVARSGAEVTVVFDGAELAHRPAAAPPRGVRVRFSPAGTSADEVLVDLVSAEPSGRPVVVVSSDAEVVFGVVSGGARAVSAATLVRLLGSRGVRTVGGRP